MDFKKLFKQNCKKKNLQTFSKKIILNKKTFHAFRSERGLFMLDSEVRNTRKVMLVLRTKYNNVVITEKQLYD